MREHALLEYVTVSPDARCHACIAKQGKHVGPVLPAEDGPCAALQGQLPRMRPVEPALQN
uniref:Uncharacterized protein n=1 Tax=Rubinisphaera brasiliensis (strain ATCC 49424 / DSM 5305 / JCM 21570 / IAM 15109 / NBRC 103401 / IFAM 1448) TaxID=756272 RepID=F0SFB8_RUBBR|nr:hypothetical protein Plabr_1714 [Rubinisphaera brasiliensis DSM 5305]